MNAGDFAIADITNDGTTLVFDARNTVNDIVTKALSIGGAVEAPAEDMSINDSQIDDSTIDDSHARTLAN